MALLTWVQDNWDAMGIGTAIGILLKWLLDQMIHSWKENKSSAPERRALLTKVPSIGERDILREMARHGDGFLRWTRTENVGNAGEFIYTDELGILVGGRVLNRSTYIDFQPLIVKKFIFQLASSAPFHPPHRLTEIGQDLAFTLLEKLPKDGETQAISGIRPDG